MKKRFFGITINWLPIMIKEFGVRDGIRIYWLYTRTSWILHRTKALLVKLRKNITLKIFNFRMKRIMKRTMKKSVKVFSEMTNVLLEIGDAASDCALAMEDFTQVYCAVLED